MKIKYENFESTTFGKLNNGELFQDGGDIYMKTEPIYIENIAKFNCVCLHIGLMDYRHNNYPVKTFNGTLVENYKGDDQ